MIREALEYLAKLTRAEVRTTFEQLPGDRADVFRQVNPDGSVERLVLGPHPRTMTAGTLLDLCNTAIAHFDKNIDNSDRMLILYGAGYAELVFDHLDTAERMRFQTGHTREWEFFHSMFQSRHAALSVKAATQLFDTTLRETVGDIDAWLKQIGNLKVVTEQQETAERDAASSLTGGLVTQQASGSKGAPLPPGLVTFNVRPWQAQELKARVPIKVYVRADLDNRCWYFEAVESSMLEAVEAATNLIGERIDSILPDEREFQVIRGVLTQFCPSTMKRGNG